MELPRSQRNRPRNPAEPFQNVIMLSTSSQAQARVPPYNTSLIM